MQHLQQITAFWRLHPCLYHLGLSHTVEWPCETGPQPQSLFCSPAPYYPKHGHSTGPKKHSCRKALKTTWCKQPALAIRTTKLDVSEQSGNAEEEKKMERALYYLTSYLRFCISQISWPMPLNEESPWTCMYESSGFISNTVVKIVERERVKEHSTTPLSSLDQDQTWQRPCTETRQVKTLWILFKGWYCDSTRM